MSIYGISRITNEKSAGAGMAIDWRHYFKSNKTKKTIYQCFKPVLKISGLAGICTVIERKNSYVFSFGLVLFQTVAIFLNVVHLGFVPKVLLCFEKIPTNISKCEREHFDFMTKMAQPLAISLSSLILRVLNVFLLHKNLPGIFKKLEMAKRYVDFRNINSKDYGYAKFHVALILMLSVPYQVWSLLDELQEDSENIPRLAIFGFNHYNNFSSLCLDTQFSYVCYILKNRFQIVNDHLRQIRRQRVGNLFLAVCETPLKSMQQLRDCHLKLCECCEQLNKLYDAQLLITLSNLLINVLLNLYFAIFGGFGMGASKSTEGNPTLQNIFKEAIWGFYYFVRFFDICAVADNLTREAGTTKVLLGELLASCSDRNMKELLWAFYAHSTARKVEFTAMRFFKVNLGLISSAISTGTTYLVILAQFHGQKMP